MLVAGEVSGDLHGASLVEAIRRIDPSIHFYGVGGEGLKKQGMDLLYHSSSFSVVGITEVLYKLRFLWKAFRGLKRSIDRERPDLIILIDFPDFNLRLAEIACRKGVPVLYYVSPQVWAWRPKRVKLIARLVKKMIVFFPFEVPLYEKEGVDVEWVGHPLLDIVKPSLSKEKALQQFGLDPRRRTVGLLPGSRMQEVERLLPPLLASAQLLHREIPELQFILPLAPAIQESALSREMKRFPVPVKVVQGLPYDVMNISELLITASGTATLEGAILRKPMVIVYKVSFFSYWIGRAMIRVDHIGLVNLVAGKEIAPELIQNEACAERIAEESLRILKNPALCGEMTESMEKVRLSLGAPGAVARAAQIVTSLLQDKEL